MQIVTGSRVFTADPNQPWAEALVIENERISFVGSLAAALDTAGPDAPIVTAAGVVMPGFVDAHAHIMGTGAGLLKAQLRDAPDLATIQQRLLEWAEAHPTAPRVLGLGWLFSAVPDGTPTRQMLDEIIPDRPVYLDAMDFHSAWVNSAALAEMEIGPDTPDPIGGTIVRDAEGISTGLLLETACENLAWPIANRASTSEQDAHLRATIDAYHASGVTTSVDMGLDESALRTMIRCRDQGELTLRIIAHWIIRRDDDPAVELAQVARAAELAATHATGQLKIVGIKVIVDGTIDACTAGMIEPYSNGLPGSLIWGAEALQRVVIAADTAGLQIALHAIGDLAVRTAIDALEVAAHANPARDRRHRIEHLEYVDPADIGRLAPLGITASMQPVHIDPAVYANWGAMLGESRAHHGFAWPEYLAHGTTLAFGTDTPTAPYEPLPNMYIAATRCSPGEPSLPPHRPDFALPVDEAIVHGTRDAAWASFGEHEFGMLRAGLAADVIMLDRDPFGRDRDRGAESLLAARVVRTIVGGQTVFAAPFDAG
jgi:predicted amidohydrolase YtcJ